jgi:hypothetical protein
MNNWLKANGGFSGNLIIWGAVSKMGIRYIGRSDRSKIAGQLAAGNGVICAVKGGGHYVLVTGVSGSNLNVNDPGSNTKNSYPASECAWTQVYSK